MLAVFTAWDRERTPYLIETVGPEYKDRYYLGHYIQGKIIRCLDSNKKTPMNSEYEREFNIRDNRLRYLIDPNDILKELIK